MKKWTAIMILGALGFAPSAWAGIDEDLWVMMLAVNTELEKQGKNLQIEKIEYLTAGEAVGREVFFSDRGNKQLSSHWVPGDPRREWSTGTDITWASDGTEGDAGVGFVATQTAVFSAMETWEDVKCSNIPLSPLGVSNFDLGFVAYFFGIGPPAPIVADISHAGFGTVLDPYLPPPVIAATFTLIWTSGGAPTDIDNNGKTDTALREIYYTNNYPWAIAPAPGGGIDIETVVLHETGHALSQAHFGELFRTDRNGKFHFSPRAVMNAGYTGIQTKIRRSDNAGHCSIWASWPNN
jgi:hypothetical protein